MMVTVRSSPVTVMMLVTGVGVHVELWVVGELVEEVEVLDVDVTNVEDSIVSGMEVDGGMIVVVTIVGGSAEDSTCLVLSLASLVLVLLVVGAP